MAALFVAFSLDPALFPAAYLDDHPSWNLRLQDKWFLVGGPLVHKPHYQLIHQWLVIRFTKKNRRVITSVYLSAIPGDIDLQ